jgi:N-acetylglucosaminyldiphosphoundecaprenol N-acetyl-beta-D-mannosaminyltransferase
MTPPSSNLHHPPETNEGVDLGLGSALVLNTPCLVTSFIRLSDGLHHHAETGQRPLSIDFTNVHIVTMRRHDPEFERQTSSVDFFVSDSTVLSWFIWLFGGRGGSRLYGPSFMARFIQTCRPGSRHFFVGGSDLLLENLLSQVGRRRPDIAIVGSHHGYLHTSGADDKQIVEAINSSSPDFIWVGMGTPRQQQWIHRNKAFIKRGVVLAVGFAFDVNAGTKKDAPAWMQGLGLTWLYRLIQEPMRLGPRYLRYNSLFLGYLAAQAFHKLIKRWQ